MFEEEFYTKDLILVDANKDGKLDLLVSQDSDYGEDDDAEDWVGSLRVYEIPRSEDFKLETCSGLQLFLWLCILAIIFEM